MDESLISVRYSTALFSLAKEKNLMLPLKRDIDLILTVCNQSADFNHLLSSPVIKPSEKIRAVRAIFDKKINGLTMNFLELTIRNNRETFIPAVCRVVLEFIRKEKNIKTAVITTAREFDTDALKDAEKILKEELEAEVELTWKVNPRLIGGLVLQIDDKQYDAAVSTQLNKLKQEMLKNQLLK